MKFINVLKKGNCLKNPIFWKNIQSLINLVGGSATLICIIFPNLTEYLTEHNLIAFSSFIGAMNIYFTNATSTQVGI